MNVLCVLLSNYSENFLKIASKPENGERATFTHYKIQSRGKKVKDGKIHLDRRVNYNSGNLEFLVTCVGHVQILGRVACRRAAGIFFFAMMATSLEVKFICLQQNAVQIKNIFHDTPFSVQSAEGEIGQNLTQFRRRKCFVQFLLKIPHYNDWNRYFTAVACVSNFTSVIR